MPLFITGDHWPRLRALAGVALCVPQLLVAQAPVPTDTSSAAHGRFFTGHDAVVAGLFAIGTVAMFPIDQRVAREMKGSPLHKNSFIKTSSDVFRLTAQPGSTIIGGSLYVVGRLAHNGRMTDLGLHGTEALLIGQAIGSIAKGTLGRARPYMVADSNAADFAFMRGFRKGNDFSSFPSGHTISAFAAAAAVTAETSRWWPRSTPYVATLMYGGATMVALERLYDDKHWASDVVLAAAIGTFSGLKVVKYNHDHPRNRIDRIFLTASIAPSPAGGAMLTWSIVP
jgi:membrane-associated phospholipid phosphatase